MPNGYLTPAQSPGLEQYAMRAFAEALDAVPMALAENSGLSPIETLANIKSRQAKEKNTRLGVDCMQTGSNGKSCPSCSSPDIDYLHFTRCICSPCFVFAHTAVFRTRTAARPRKRVASRSRGAYISPLSAPPRDVARCPHATTSRFSSNVTTTSGDEMHHTSQFLAVIIARRHQSLCCF